MKTYADCGDNKYLYVAMVNSRHKLILMVLHKPVHSNDINETYKNHLFSKTHTTCTTVAVFEPRARACKFSLMHA